jgi:hypothetical protein
MGEQGSAAYHRRLSDRIIAAFDLACEREDMEVADALYRTLELVLTRQGGAGKTERRGDVSFILDASAKLHRLREKSAAA